MWDVSTPKLRSFIEGAFAIVQPGELFHFLAHGPLLVSVRPLYGPRIRVAELADSWTRQLALDDASNWQKMAQ